MLIFDTRNEKKQLIPLVCILCFFFIKIFNPIAIHAKSQDQNSAKKLFYGYEEQIRFIEMELETLENNLSFLEFNIYRMKTESRFVPNRMKESVKFKKAKIKALKSLRYRYQKLISKRKTAKKTDQNLSSSVAIHKNKKNTASIKPATVPKNLGKKKIDSIMKHVDKAGLSDWLESVPHNSCTCLETRLPILFSSGSAKIPKGYQSFLKKLAFFVKNYDVRILINGYADTDPINTSTYPSNFELGASRAGSIVRSLIGYGIKPSVFEVASSGQYNFKSKKNVKWKNLQRHAIIKILFPDCQK